MKGEEEEEEEEEEVVVFTCKNRGGSALHATPVTKPRSGKSLALCHPYLQQRYSVHPRHQEERAVFVG